MNVRPRHQPSSRSGVSTERRHLQLPESAALFRDAATPGLTRRHFLKTAGAAVVIFSLAPLGSAALATTDKHPSAKRGGLIDTNVTLGRWPFRRLPLDNTSELVAMLRKQGVTQAWAGNFDALLSPDLAAANARLAEECRRHGRGLLVPFGSVTPKVRGWEEQLSRCHEEHKMPGLRLYPNYHGYKLDEPAFAKLLSLAQERGLVVQIAVSMEDERMQRPPARVPHVDVNPLLTLLKNPPAPRVVLLNWHRAVKLDLAKKLTELGVCFEIATLEGVGGVANLVQEISAGRVLFGSHAPFFYFESALLKLKESALKGGQLRAVREGNAKYLRLRS